jgi:hypothetical protein
MPRHLPRPLTNHEDITRRVSESMRRMRSEHSIGDLLMWKIDNAEISRADLETLLAKRGISNEWMPTEIRSKVAARKAISKVRKDLEEGTLKVLVRKIRETDKEVRYALIDEAADTDAARLDYSERNQVIFNKTDATIEFKGDEIDEIQEKFLYYSTIYTQREILMLIENIVMRWGGIPMNDGSGMYFMPVAVRDITDALYGLLNEDLNGTYGKSFLRPLGITNKEEDKREMGEVVRSNVTDELLAAREKLDELLEKEVPTPQSIRFALERYKLAAGKASMYKQLLAINLDEIEESITEGQAKLAMLLGLGEEDELELVTAE